MQSNVGPYFKAAAITEPVFSLAKLRKCCSACKVAVPAIAALAPTPASDPIHLIANQIRKQGNHNHRNGDTNFNPGYSSVNSQFRH